ncbi:glycoside hydrolase N-terminal domain-containing protein [Paenibacillus alba]|uniref:glycoside hydrolase N-terminal domain-containing protein n=1 Tax=Paenibacillus alba TaxID=1197127 RepID=UPI003B849F92
MNDWKLRYTRSAQDWSQGLPLGNGRLGAVVYGGKRLLHMQMTLSFRIYGASSLALFLLCLVSNG